MPGRTRRLACCTVICVAVMAAAPAANADLTPGCAVRHWGSFSGGSTSAQDILLSPAEMAFHTRSPVVQVGSSNSTQYALLANGTLWAWGQGENGQLGNGSRRNSLSTPVHVRFPPGVSIAYIPVNSMPFNTALAVDTQGNAWGWGLNGNGELCLGNTMAHELPVRLPLTDVTALAGASGHAVYDSGAVVYSCGANRQGVLGAGPQYRTTALRPVRVSSLDGSQVTTLVSSFENAGALLSDGQYYDWGLNSAGQLGDGTTTSSSVPVPASLPDHAGVIQVAEGGSEPYNGQTLVRLADGSLYAWGDNSYDQIDPVGPAAQLAPVQFRAPAGTTYALLASGGGTSYAITTSGDVYAWGESDYGQAGDGSTGTAFIPALVASGASLISSTARDVVVGC
jgi:alpha-tubulin suppressor-like RCC1 family protein